MNIFPAWVGWMIKQKLDPRDNSIVQSLEWVEGTRFVIKMRFIIVYQWNQQGIEYAFIYILEFVFVWLCVFLPSSTDEKKVALKPIFKMLALNKIQDLKQLHTTAFSHLNLTHLIVAPSVSHELDALF